MRRQGLASIVGDASNDASALFEAIAALLVSVSTCSVAVQRHDDSPREAGLKLATRGQRGAIGAGEDHPASHGGARPHTPFAGSTYTLDSVRLGLRYTHPGYLRGVRMKTTRITAHVTDPATLTGGSR